MLEPFFTGRQPKELLPDKSIVFRSKAPAVGFRGLQELQRVPHQIKCCWQVGATRCPTMLVVWEVAKGMLVQVMGSGVAQTDRQKLM